ncbi:PhoH family protein, partial [Burkholderia pseudomallei]|nr:PhoH family protein [Burkholderia pseudomallei]MEB5503517.1 PhoH family protein [Burkholderia pseudomallei]
MPLPTPPSKLGSLLPPDEYKAKARPAKAAKQSASGGPAHAAAADYSPASVAEPMVVAANTTTPLRAVAPAADASAGAPRARRAKQTA